MATMIPDQPVPSMASALAAELGIPRATAFDLNAACSGWLYALEVGRALILGGTAGQGDRGDGRAHFQDHESSGPRDGVPLRRRRGRRDPHGCPGRSSAAPDGAFRRCRAVRVHPEDGWGRSPALAREPRGHQQFLYPDGRRRRVQTRRDRVRGEDRGNPEAREPHPRRHLMGRAPPGERPDPEGGQQARRHSLREVRRDHREIRQHERRQRLDGARMGRRGGDFHGGRQDHLLQRRGRLYLAGGLLVW